MTILPARIEAIFGAAPEAQIRTSALQPPGYIERGWRGVNQASSERAANNKLQRANFQAIQNFPPSQLTLQKKKA
jgi:hypothetical protein